MPVAGVISDGQHPIRRAVARVLLGVPHLTVPVPLPQRGSQRGLRGRPPRQKGAQKARARVRPIERELEGREDPEAEAVHGYCLAVRSAITDDGRPPLSAWGIKLHDRIEAIEGSIERVGAKRGFQES